MESLREKEVAASMERVAFTLSLSTRVFFGLVLLAKGWEMNEPLRVKKDAGWVHPGLQLNCFYCCTTTYFAHDEEPKVITFC